MLVITSLVITSGALGYFCQIAKSPELLILCRLIAGVHTGQFIYQPDPPENCQLNVQKLPKT